MREILFRGKHKSSGKWCEGNLHIDNQNVAIITPDNTPLGCYGLVDSATVGQYTGLTDKNGNKMFEGDIVRAVLPKSNAITEFVWPIMVVVFSEGAFAVMRGRYCTPLYSFAPAVELEVIGNIHDNPELMEDK